MKTPKTKKSLSVHLPAVFSGQSLLPVLAHIHYCVGQGGANNIILDFSKCNRVLESAMLPLIPIINRHMTDRPISFELILPKDRNLSQWFEMYNWAHFIDPFRYRYVTGASSVHCPVIRYSTAEEQFLAVDQILSVIMKSTDVTSDALKAIEWSLNEITDNVLNHAGRNVSGYVQATWFRKNNVVEFVVADGGMGIPNSLRQRDHLLALEQAIQEGVTRDKNTNHGNGLYGSFRISQTARGAFTLLSQNGQLTLSPNGELKIRNSKIPYTGTTVLWNMNTKSSDVLAKALVFDGKSYDISHSYLDRLADAAGGRVTINLKERFSSFGSRQAGARAYNLIKNIIGNDSEILVDIDFSDVNIISSSFADEVFGRIFLDIGPIAFMNRIKFLNADSQILLLIDRAIIQRSSLSK